MHIAQGRKKENEWAGHLIQEIKDRWVYGNMIVNERVQTSYEFILRAAVNTYKANNIQR